MKFHKFILIGIPLGLILIFWPNLKTPHIFERKKDLHIEYEKELIIPTPVGIPSFDPGSLADIIQKSFLSIIYSRLISINKDFDVEPDILVNWRYDLDENKFYLKLRDDVYFSNGKKLNADDVFFSFHIWCSQTYLESNLLLQIKGALDYRNKKNKKILGIEKVSENEIGITLENIDDRFILNLSSPRFVIFPNNFAGLTKEQYFIKPIGSGPYTVIKNSPSETLLKRNLNYFKGIPKTEQIIINLQDTNTAIKNFNQNKLTNLIFYNDIQEKDILSKHISKHISSHNADLLILNPKANNGLLNDLNTRRQLIEIFPTKDALLACYQGGEIIKNIIPKGFVGSFKQNISYNPININKGREKFRIKHLTIYLEDDSKSNCLEKLIKENLSHYNIEVKSLPFEKIFNLFKQNKLSAWIERMNFKNEDPYSVLQYFWSNSNEYLLGQEFRVLDNLFTSLNNGVSTDTKAILYTKIENFLINNYLVNPLVSSKNNIIYSPRIRNLEINGNRYYIANWHNLGVAREF